MFPHKTSIRAQVEPKTYPLGEKTEPSRLALVDALVALSHSPLEHRLYSAMRAAENDSGSPAFTARRLESLTGINSLSTIRRGLEGLRAKLSIERSEKSNGNGERVSGASFIALAPEQIIARRNERGVNTYDKALDRSGKHSFERAIARIAENEFLSRREAEVALCCVQGLTNAEIGNRLEVSEQTIKFHLRHIFIKFGVKRRTGLISRLLL